MTEGRGTIDRSKAVGRVVVVTDRRGAAEAYAEVVGATHPGDGYFASARYVVTWTTGNLFELPKPEQLEPSWRNWELRALPLVPQAYPLALRSGARDQFERVRALLSASETGLVVAATAASREGELAFRWLYAASGCRKPVRRVWLTQLTASSIRAGLRAAQPLHAFDALAHAAQLRVEADWLFGVNCTRLYRMLTRSDVDVGRVLTPTLALVAECQLTRAAERSAPSRDLVVRVAQSDSVYTMPLSRLGSRGDSEGALVDVPERIARVHGGGLRFVGTTVETRATPAPRWFDLTSLQVAAYERWGWMGSRTLEMADRLHAVHRAITYPRTEARYVSRATARSQTFVFAELARAYGCRPGLGASVANLSPRFMRDLSPGEGEAIVPVATLPQNAEGDAQALYDLIARRWFAAFLGDHVEQVTTATFALNDEERVDMHRAVSASTTSEGWTEVEAPARRQATTPPFGAATLETSSLEVMVAHAHATASPSSRRCTEATLLAAMAGQRAAGHVKHKSHPVLGTPSTRASTVDRLVRLGYVLRNDQTELELTERGRQVLAVVHPDLQSGGLVMVVESLLRDVERGRLRPSAARAALTSLLHRVITEACARGRGTSAARGDFGTEVRRGSGPQSKQGSVQVEAQGRSR
ncbi:MAG TPA: DNA topoisomerase [Polyangiales bacterium]|nr:DNA topoisomerase [Polyangiales bacterium]